MSRLARWRFRRRLMGPKLLKAFAGRYPQAFFVEIGANDGSQHDHLRRLVASGEWRGVMVEPVPYVFARLRANYGHLADRVALENVAVAPEAGTMRLFHLAEAPEHERGRHPGWYDAIGSFSREAVLSHAGDIPDIESRLVETEVPTVPFADLVARHGDGRPDLVVIDTEGYDSTIIRSIDLDALGPRLLIYEHFHLDAEDRDATRRHLEAHGYETVEEWLDTFALDVRPDDALTRRWRRLTPGVPGVSVHER